MKLGRQTAAPWVRCRQAPLAAQFGISLQKNRSLQAATMGAVHRSIGGVFAGPQTVCRPHRCDGEVSCGPAKNSKRHGPLPCRRISQAYAILLRLVIGASASSACERPCLSPLLMNFLYLRPRDQDPARARFLGTGRLRTLCCRVQK